MLDLEQPLENQHVLAYTLSGQYTSGALTIIPEVRLDNASIDVFDGGESSSLASVVLAAIYAF